MSAFWVNIAPVIYSTQFQWTFNQEFYRREAHMIQGQTGGRDYLLIDLL